MSNEVIYSEPRSHRYMILVDDEAVQWNSRRPDAEKRARFIAADTIGWRGAKTIELIDTWGHHPRLTITR